MKNQKKNTQTEYQQASVIKFDSIKKWTSKKGSMFYQIRIGRNYIFVSEALLNHIKKQAA